MRDFQTHPTPHPNQERLINFMRNFQNERADEQFVEEKSFLVQEISQLQRHQQPTQPPQPPQQPPQPPSGGGPP